MAEPRERFAVSDLVVGAERCEVMAERVELEGLGLTEVQFLADRFHASEQASLQHAGEHVRFTLRQCIEQRPHPWMDGHESGVLVFRRAVGPAAVDVEHAEFAVLEFDISPSQLNQFPDAKPGIGERRKGGLFLPYRVGKDRFDLGRGETGLRRCLRLGHFGVAQTVRTELSFLVSPLEDLLSENEGAVDCLRRIRLLGERLAVAEERVPRERRGKRMICFVAKGVQLGDVGTVFGFALGCEPAGLDHAEVVVGEFAHRQFRVIDARFTVLESMPDFKSLATGLDATVGVQVLAHLLSARVAVFGGVDLAGHTDAVPVIHAAADGDALDAFAVLQLHGFTPRTNGFMTR